MSLTDREYEAAKTAATRAWQAVMGDRSKNASEAARAAWDAGFDAIMSIRYEEDDEARNRVDLLPD